MVDDGSTDDTADVAAAFSDHIRYVRQPNQGPAAARNSGTRIAWGSSWRFSTSMIYGLTAPCLGSWSISWLTPRSAWPRD